MLGISFGEIIIIGAIGLVIVGPKRLPETARFLGHLFNRIQRQVNSVKSDIRREMALEDMKNIHREYKETAHDVQNAFDQAARGVPPPETLLADDGKQTAEAANTPDTTARNENDNGLQPAAPVATDRTKTGSA